MFLRDRATGHIVNVCLREGRIAVAAEELRAVGLVIPPDLPEDEDGRIPLDVVPGLAYRYEVETQSLILRPPPALRPVQHLGYEPPPPVRVRRDAGWLMTYDAFGRRQDGRGSLAATGMLRRFGRFGAVEVTGISHVGDGRARHRRLESRWTYSDPVRMWTWTVGDFINGGLAWTRPVRIAGVRWQRNFGVRPDLITRPLARFSGSATVPASVELYVNNIQQFSGEVQDGPFVLDVPPRIGGAGHASLIVTDALGRVTETTVSLYADHRRLARGLTDFSLEAGVLRYGFATDGDRYGRRPVGSASIRHGLTNTFTVEGHAEAGAGFGLAGLGAVWSPADRWGLLSASYAQSYDDSWGGQYSVGYRWDGPRWGFDLERVYRATRYRDLGDHISELAPDTIAVLPGLRDYDRATVWFAVPRGSVGLTWLRWRDHDGDHHDTSTLSWTQNLGRVSVSASIYDGSGGRGGGLRLSVPLGDRLQAGAGVQRSGGRTSPVVTMRRNAPYSGGWGWVVQAGGRSTGYVQAAAEIRGRLGDLRFGVDGYGDGVGTFVQGGGSAVLMDGQLFMSRRIYDGFAVVSTNGTANVPILIENRRYGRTGSDGYLLIPDLRGWQRNLIGIDPDDLPPDVAVGALEQIGTPADRAGVLLQFNVAEIRPATLTLLGPEGERVPAGTRARVVETRSEIVVGFDGQVYIEDLSTAVVIELDVDDVHCRYRVPARPGPAAVPLSLGPFPCERIEP